ncbi:MAG: 3-hydroxyacyl-CoA dehydrogenase [Kiloniellales bacterium]|nr:3-hydroxyacyl-CoA dehydrogenase [Kiloniellales bacterium]
MTADKIALVGTGLIGRAWAVAFARGGRRVALWDAQPGAAAAALDLIPAMLDDLAEAGLLGGQAPAAVLARIEVAPELAAALEGAGYVQESAPEVLETKIEITAAIDELAGPEAVIASSTSGFVPSAFTETLPGRARCLVAHPINPPYLLPAVEIVPAPWTAPAAVDTARRVLEAVGQDTVVLCKELDGFVLNRLQAAVLCEAFRLVAEGYVSAADLDRAMAGGLGPRWSFMGPFETIDLNAPEGIRQYVERYEPLCQRLVPSQKVPCDWTAALDAGLEAARREALPKNGLGERQAWRDRRLMALAAHKHRAAREIGD